MKIAVTGCAHGELDKIYAAIGELERQRNFKVCLLLNCGDFQAVRNPADLQALAAPSKFRQLNSFYKFYSGECQAPYLTIFIGGNHEASNYLAELPYGGWAAPNIYYLGMAGCLRFGKLRIAGISGIHKPYDYTKGHFEAPPYDETTRRSVFHFRSLEVFRLKQLGDGLDVFLSHDWPVGIYQHGDTAGLVRAKRFFQQEVQNNTLGAQPLRDLLDTLMPKHWFAAHLHVKFAAVYKKTGKPAEAAPEEKQRTTKFLALDKCLPGRGFLQILDFDTGLEDEALCDPDDFAKKLQYDPDWLAILKSTDHLLNHTPRTVYMPGPSGTTEQRHDFKPTDVERQEIELLFGGNFSVPLNFSLTAPIFNPAVNKTGDEVYKKCPNLLINPQSSLFCQKLGIKNLNQILVRPNPETLGIGRVISHTSGSGSANRTGLFLPPPSNRSEPGCSLFQIDTNPDEISLEDDSNLNGVEDVKVDHVIKNITASDDFLTEETQQNIDAAKKFEEKMVESSTTLTLENSAPTTAGFNTLKLPMKRRNAEIYQSSVE